MRYGAHLALITAGGDAQSHNAVDHGALTAVLDGDLVAEERRRLGAGVRDQGLIRRQFQLEVLTQERRETLLDLLGFGLGSGEPEKVIVGVADISEPAVAGVAHIPARDAAPLRA
jgi:hypothetical protein